MVLIPSCFEMKELYIAECEELEELEHFKKIKSYSLNGAFLKALFHSWLIHISPHISLLISILK